jgi:hypothetical protein
MILLLVPRKADGIFSLQHLHRCGCGLFGGNNEEKMAKVQGGKQGRNHFDEPAQKSRQCP